MHEKIKNLDAARTQLRQQHVRQILRSLMLQYGVDDLIEGLRFIYREDVYMQNRHIDAVRHRFTLLDKIVDQLRSKRG